MRILNQIAHFAYISCVGLTFLASARAARAASLPMPTGKQLTATITMLVANLLLRTTTAISRRSPDISRQISIFIMIRAA